MYFYILHVLTFEITLKFFFQKMKIANINLFASS